MAAKGIPFIDGAFVPIEEAKISVIDPAFTRSDAVYDTTSVWHGYFFRLDDHLDRFGRSCESMRLVPPYERDEIKRILAECVTRLALDDAYIQMVCTRGPFQDMLNRDPRDCKNGLIAYALPYIWIVPPKKQETGINLVIASNRRIPDEAVRQTVKNYNWMDLNRGLIEAYDRGGENTVLCTSSGNLAEGPGFNVWLIKDGTLRTPRDNVLHGITRQTVFDLATALGLKAEAGDLSAEALRDADEAFLSSTAGGIMPVTQVDGKTLGNGAPGILTSQFRAEYWRRREAGWLGTPVQELLEDRDGAQSE